ncbi:unnamed protein product, partial [Prunus brigantina]
VSLSLRFKVRISNGNCVAIRPPNLTPQLAKCSSPPPLHDPPIFQTRFQVVKRLEGGEKSRFFGHRFRLEEPVPTVVGVLPVEIACTYVARCLANVFLVLTLVGSRPECIACTCVVSSQCVYCLYSYYKRERPASDDCSQDVPLPPCRLSTQGWLTGIWFKWRSRCRPATKFDATTCKTLISASST